MQIREVLLRHRQTNNPLRDPPSFEATTTAFRAETLNSRHISPNSAQHPPFEMCPGSVGRWSRAPPPTHQARMDKSDSVCVDGTRQTRNDNGYFMRWGTTMTRPSTNNSNAILCVAGRIRANRIKQDIMAGRLSPPRREIWRCWWSKLHAVKGTHPCFWLLVSIWPELAGGNNSGVTQGTLTSLQSQYHFLGSGSGTVHLRWVVVFTRFLIRFLPWLCFSCFKGGLSRARRQEIGRPNVDFTLTKNSKRSAGMTRWQRNGTRRECWGVPEVAHYLVVFS